MSVYILLAGARADAPCSTCPGEGWDRNGGGGQPEKPSRIGIGRDIKGPNCGWNVGCMCFAIVSRCATTETTLKTYVVS